MALLHPAVARRLRRGARPRGRWSGDRFASNLLAEGKVVIEAPLLHNAPILNAEDRQFIDLNTTTAGRHASECTEMSARRMISNGYPVFVDDHVVNVLAPVRETDPEPLDCSSNTVVLMMS